MRIASGPINNTATTIATAPVRSSGTLARSLLVSMPIARLANPIAANTTAAADGRRVDFATGGRAESASVIGTRAAVRAGHQAAAVAVATARSMPAATSHQGTSN